MSALGGLFTNTVGTNTATLDRLNAKTLIEGTGAELAAVGFGSIGKGTIAYCSTTGSGFIEGVYYGLNSAKTTWVAIGGVFREYVASGINAIYWISLPCVNANNFIQEIGGTGSVLTISASGGARPGTGTTSTGYGNIAVEGLQISFASNIKLLVKAHLHQNTQLRARFGVAMPRVDTATSVLRQFGLENDPTTGAINWSLVTADGTTRSSTTTGLAVTTGGNKKWRFEFNVATNVKIYQDGTLDTTKTTNIPASSNNGGERVFMAGIQTKEAANKDLTVMGMELVAKQAEVF